MRRGIILITLIIHTRYLKSELENNRWNKHKYHMPYAMKRKEYVSYIVQKSFMIIMKKQKVNKNIFLGFCIIKLQKDISKKVYIAQILI